MANTLNDGSENIIVPNVAAPYCRIMIEPVGNIYYALSKNISIGYTVTSQTICTDYTRTFSTPVSMATGWSAFNLPSATGITQDYIITDANLTIVSTATATNEVSFGLVKPGSSVVDYVAFDGPTSGCGISASNLNVVFDDEGATFDCANTNSGLAFKPVSSFTTLDGLSSLGVWRLAAKSTSTSNTISSATLTLCRVETTVTLSNESFGLQEFSIFPNPNNGSFNVNFVSNSSNKVKISVFDIGGRSIFEDNFQNNGIFNQNIQLNNIQSGVYLVTVQDGDKKEVKKIIIE
ncbi:MAG: T9SS type A sorting domain-containing protein [Flavobacterium sp.]|nr:T9SS type A sorting domain-containing protein [Flavobacterium sp.]